MPLSRAHCGSGLAIHPGGKVVHEGSSDNWTTVVADMSYAPNSGVHTFYMTLNQSVSHDGLVFVGVCRWVRVACICVFVSLCAAACRPRSRVQPFTSTPFHVPMPVYFSRRDSIDVNRFLGSCRNGFAWLLQGEAYWRGSRTSKFRPYE